MAQQEQETHGRFFSENPEEKDKEKRESRSISIQSNESEGNKKVCWTLRIIQKCCPCLRSKGVWDASKGDVFKSHDAEEAKYPRALKILENRALDVIFIFACLMSMYLFLFSEGFLLESQLLWGIMHIVNALYATGLFRQWLQYLIKSKYAKINHGYTKQDVVYAVLSIFPADLIVLAIYSINNLSVADKTNSQGLSENPVSTWMITVSRLNYFLRLRYIMQYFSNWENHLAVG